jgi:hypothetical protein
MSPQSEQRKTISLAPVLWGMAEALMERKGFNNNFSSYVADLIRRDHERYVMTPDELTARLAPFATRPPGDPALTDRTAPPTEKHKRKAA